jgi:hypothetical protein
MNELVSNWKKKKKKKREKKGKTSKFVDARRDNWNKRVRYKQHGMNRKGKNRGEKYN